jgi:membrane-bound inhibitor of C-type lysozyme
MEGESQVSVSEQKPKSKKIWVLILGIILIFILFVGGFFLLSNFKNNAPVTEKTAQENTDKENIEPTITPSAQVSFTCAGKKAIDAKFYNEGDLPSVNLVFSNRMIITLYRVESGEKAKYANSDESMVFFNSGDKASVEEEGKETYSDCVKKS